MEPERVTSSNTAHLIENSFYSVEEYLDRNRQFDLGLLVIMAFYLSLHSLASYIYIYILTHFIQLMRS
jgi:hypothetical protein